MVHRIDLHGRTMNRRPWTMEVHGPMQRSPWWDERPYLLLSWEDIDAETDADQLEVAANH